MGNIIGYVCKRQLLLKQIHNLYERLKHLDDQNKSLRNENVRLERHINNVHCNVALIQKELDLYYHLVHSNTSSNG